MYLTHNVYITLHLRHTVSITLLYMQDQSDKMAAAQASAAKEQAAVQEGSKAPEDGWGGSMAQFKDYTLDGEDGGWEGAAGLTSSLWRGAHVIVCGVGSKVEGVPPALSRVGVGSKATEDGWDGSMSMFQD
jgi:hypothetical protein